MKKLSHREIQMAGLDILLEFDRYCHKHGLRYYITYGTLLGAIRHSGFIPWDDDIDVCMSRPEYIKLMKSSLKFSSDRFQMRSSYLNNLDAPFSELIDTSLYGRSKFSNSPRYSSWGIDIFPVDGLSDDDKVNKRIYMKQDLLKKLINISESKNNGRNVLRKFIKMLVRPLCRIYGVDRLVSKLNNLAMTMEYESSEYVGVIAWGEGVQERIRKEDFEKQVGVSFEGHIFPTFSCWDTYMHNIYGNYMELPPMELHVSHDTEVYRI